jgi:hypothetical protein
MSKCLSYPVIKKFMDNLDNSIIINLNYFNQTKLGKRQKQVQIDRIDKELLQFGKDEDDFI